MLNYPSQLYSVIYTEDCDEFESVRWKCLQEKNWLRENYYPQNFKVSDYDGVCVAYDRITNEPCIFGGLWKQGYPNGVAQVAKRTYTFPQHRAQNYEEMKCNWVCLHDTIIEPLREHSPYQTGFIGMQNRENKSKGWLKVMERAVRDTWPGWSLGKDYINTCLGVPTRECWQNYFIWGEWDIWSPELITEKQWRHL